MSDPQPSFRSPAAVAWIERHRRWLVPAVFLIATLAEFRTTLWSKSLTFSYVLGDLIAQFIPWRSFGFGELARGHLALWNPFVYGGAPFFGGFQSALLYLLNWPYLFLPTVIAINWGMALHVFLAGWFTYVWCRAHRLGVCGSVLGGLTFMFSGPFFLRCFAGHLPHQCVMIWTPLILRCIDGLAQDGRPRWWLIGMLAVAMQVFAGHPQYVYYTGIGAGIYAIVITIQTRRWKPILAGVLLVYVGGAALSAVQLGAGIDATSESLRAGDGGPTAYAFASMMPLAPADLVTSFAPYFFCTGTAMTPELVDGYWGSKYAWESSLFVGAVPLLLAAMALISPGRRRVWPALVMGGIAIVLALGVHLPIYRVLYDYLPGYGSFRGTSKFGFLFVLTISLGAAVGFDDLLRKPRLGLTLGAIAIALAAATFAAGGAIRSSASSADGAWAHWLASMADTESATRSLSYAADEARRPDIIARTGLGASQSLNNAALIFAALGVLAAFTAWQPSVSLGIAGLAAIQLLLAAYGGSSITPLSIPHAQPEWLTAINALPPNDRVLGIPTGSNDLAMDFQKADVWGYDPMVLRRYAEFMFAAQNEDPSLVVQYCDWTELNPKMLSMVRCRYVLFDRTEKPVRQLSSPLPMASLIGRTRVVADRDATLAAIKDDRFDPRQMVFVEAPPAMELRDVPDPGSVQVVRTTSDEIELTAQVTSPGVLLVTNAYSHGWKASSIGPSPQPSYDVLPVDWALQGIPLAAGTHHILLRYRPDGFIVGAWISVLAAIGYSAAVGIYWKRSRQDSNLRPSD